MFFSNLDPSHMRNSGFSVVSFYLLVSEEWHFHWGGYAVQAALVKSLSRLKYMAPMSQRNWTTLLLLAELYFIAQDPPKSS